MRKMTFVGYISTKKKAFSTHHTTLIQFTDSGDRLSFNSTSVKTAIHLDSLPLDHTNIKLISAALNHITIKNTF